MNLTRYLAFGLLVLLITFFSMNRNVYCQNTDPLDLKNLQKDLESEDFLKRRDAQNALADKINKINEPKQQEEMIGMLLRIIQDKKASNLLKSSISYSIGQLRTFFWKVKNQEEAEIGLYKLFKQTPDPALKKNIDSALMKADGLYWDAIHDYNEGRLGKPTVNKAVKKFERVFNDFDESAYASRAHYFLAKYYTRVYLKRKDAGFSANLNEWIAEKSNSTYQEYFKRVEEGKYKPTELINARYYLALNWVLLDQFDNAIDEIEKIRKSPLNDEQTIYVYEYYYSRGNGNVINAYFPSDQLALYTITYLKNNKKHNENYLKEFVVYLNKFVPGE